MYFWPKVVISATQVSMTALISGWLIRGRVTLDLGLKHITLHVPRAAADLRELFFTFATRFRINITLEKKKSTLEKRVASIFWLRNILKQCREVIVENKCCLIPKQSFELVLLNTCVFCLLWVGLATWSGDPRAKGVCRVKLWSLLLGHLFNLVTMPV